MNSNKIKRLKKQFKKTRHHRAQFRLFSSPDRSYYAFDGDNGEAKLVYFTEIGRLPIVAAYPTDMATSQRDKMIRVLYDKREERWSDR